MPSNSHETSYPTLVEALRFLLVSFDLKAANKQIDDKSTASIDPREIDAFIQELIVEKIEVLINADAAHFISEHIRQFKNQYIDLIKEINADGVTRNQLMTLLMRYIFPHWAATFYKALHAEFGGPSSASLFVEHKLAVPQVLDWASKTYPNWIELLKSQPKEQQDKVARWAKGQELPLSSSVGLLSSWVGDGNTVCQEVNTVQILLLMSRGIDYWRREVAESNRFMNSVLLQLWQEPYVFLEQYQIAIRENKQNILQSKLSIHSSIAYLQETLKPHTPKDNNARQETRRHLDNIRENFRNQGVLPGMQYWLDWSEAKWYVFSGDLDTAKEFYKKAFEGVMYQGGDSAKDIIGQSRIVVSSLEKPDKVFLKHLKWAAIQFGYEIPASMDNEASNKFSDNVEDWEITAFKNKFYSFFPKEGLFAGTEFGENLTPVMFYLGKQDVKPDYRLPNRKINVAEKGELKMPQLNWFIIEEDYGVFCRLLDEGARPNVCSDSKDTPLQLSLCMLSVQALDNPSFDDRFFWKLAELPHDKNIVNLPSAKKNVYL